jgi:hypothetical protein
MDDHPSPATLEFERGRLGRCGDAAEAGLGLIR